MLGDASIQKEKDRFDWGFFLVPGFVLIYFSPPMKKTLQFLDDSFRICCLFPYLCNISVCSGDMFSLPKACELTGQEPKPNVAACY